MSSLMHYNADLTCSVPSLIAETHPASETTCERLHLSPRDGTDAAINSTIPRSASFGKL